MCSAKMRDFALQDTGDFHHRIAPSFRWFFQGKAALELAVSKGHDDASCLLLEAEDDPTSVSVGKLKDTLSDHD